MAGCPAGGSKYALPSPDRDWVWREDRVQELLANQDTDVLFVSGCAENMGKFLSQFDHMLLLSAPADVIAERLRSRTNNQYGTRPEELAQVMELLQTVEPLLRRTADHVLDTRAPLHETVAAVLSFADEESPLLARPM